MSLESEISMLHLTSTVVHVFMILDLIKVTNKPRNQYGEVIYSNKWRSCREKVKPLARVRAPDACNVLTVDRMLDRMI
jgi:hypothetical protein